MSTSLAWTAEHFWQCWGLSLVLAQGSGGVLWGAGFQGHQRADFAAGWVVLFLLLCMWLFLSVESLHQQR
jgi:hypothetical protein